MTGFAHKLKGSSKCWLDAALDFIYPPVCQICGGRRCGALEGYVCADCWIKGVRFIKAPFCDRCGLPYQGEITISFDCSNCREMDLQFRYARSAVVAGGTVLEVIHRYKYNRALWFEPFLADVLVRQAEPLLNQERWDMMIPVPLHPVKQREREFNQAERLAAPLSRALKIPLRSDILRRTTETRTQTLLSRSERAANVRHAFALKTSDSLRGLKIIVFDDVLTTGATTSACARELRAAGAEDVCVWTVARGL